MKKYILLTLSMFIFLSNSTVAHAASFSQAGLNFSEEQDPNQNLVMALGEILQVNVTKEPQNLHFHGDQETLRKVVSYFNNFDAIRCNFIPSSADHKRLNAHIGLCRTIQEYFAALDLSPEEFSNFNIGDITSASDTILLPYTTKNNKRAASLFEDIAAEMSPFIPWAIQNIEGFRTNDDCFVKYSFRELDGYLCGLDDRLAPKEEDYSSGSIRIPEEWILKHLIAATSGDVSLRKTEKESVFKIVTTSSSEKASSAISSEVKLIVDASSSMKEAPINQVNEALPMIYEEISKVIRYPVNVTLLSFSADLKTEYTFTIHPIDSINRYTYVGNLIPYSSFPPVAIRATTDLTYIGNTIISNERGIVIAFSDGEHTSDTSLPGHYQTLEKNKKSGHFAYPVTCSVGTDISYFNTIKDIFGGKTFPATDIPEFLKSIQSAARDILSPRLPLMLTLNGVSLTDWVLDKTGIQSGRNVSRGDTVIYNGITYTIDPSK